MFIRQPGNGGVDAGEPVEGIVGVEVVALFGVNGGDVGFGVKGVGTLQQIGLVRTFDVNLADAGKAVGVLGSCAAAGVELALRLVPGVEGGGAEAAGGREFDFDEPLGFVPGVVDPGFVRPGLVGFPAGWGVAGFEGVGLVADGDAFLGSSAQGIQGVVGTVALVIGVSRIAVGVAGELASGVPGVGDGAGRGVGSGRGVGFLDAAVGVVVG